MDDGEVLFRDSRNNTTLRNLAAPLPMIVSVAEKRFRLWSRTNLTGEIVAVYEEDRTVIVSREQAAYLVHEYLKGRPELAAYQVGDVKDLGEIRSKEPRPSGLSSEELADAWIVYFTGGPKSLGESVIAVVAKADGRVLFLGDAAEEG